MGKQGRVAGVLRAGLVISLSASMATWMPVQYAQAAAVAAEGSAAGTSDVAGSSAAGTSDVAGAAAASTGETKGADAASEAGGNTSAEASGTTTSDAAEAGGSRADSSAGEASAAEAATGGTAAAKASPALAPAASAATGPTVTGNVTVDGSDADWGGVTAQATTTTTNGIDSWKVARDASGNVYLLAQGTASNQWDYNYQWTNVGIVRDGSTVNSPQLAGLQWSGGSFASVNEANGTTAGPFTAEALIPASMLTGSDAISFLGTTVSLADIPVLDGNDYVAPDEPATYDGITVDGKFDDWKAVSKTDASCPNPAHPNCLSKTAMVFDGDNVYIYIKEGAGGSAAGAGSHSNGMYAITTDLGRTLTFQLNGDGTVSVNAPQAATASHVGSQWEICIPAADLPNYLDTLSFGLYQGDTFVSGVSNLNGKGSGGSFSGITMDGSYDDWAYYPHNTVEYATAGTQSNVADSEAALWADGSSLYGHVESTMPAHLASQGGDFLSAVSIAFNGDRAYKQNPSDGNFYPKFYTVDEQGNITVLNEGTRLPQGTTCVYIADTRTDFSSRNYNDLRDDEKFGRMYVTVAGDKMEAEFELDLTKVGAYVGQDPSTFNTVEIQWGRMGQQWTSVSGTSTSPFVGVGLCCAVAAGTLAYRRRKDGPAGGEAPLGR